MMSSNGAADLSNEKIISIASDLVSRNKTPMDEYKTTTTLDQVLVLTNPINHNSVGTTNSLDSPLRIVDEFQKANIELVIIS